MRRFPLLLPWLLLQCLGAALLLPGGCAPKAIDMMQPPPATLRGQAWVVDVQLSLGGPSRASVAAADAKLRERRPAAAGPASDDTALPFAQMFVKMVKDVARERGLASGRAVTVSIEMDQAQVQGTGMAALGRGDRLAGQVRVLDARSGDKLAEFYVDVDKIRPGLIGLAIRGTGVREKLAGEFARRIADQLTAPR